MVVQKASSKLQFEQMAIDELMQIRGRADALIGEKLVSEKKALQEKLSAIERYESRVLGAQPAKQQQYRSKVRRVAPKYQDPLSGATWAGRGQMPRWMAKLVAQGSKPEEFLIARTDHDRTPRLRNV